MAKLDKLFRLFRDCAKVTAPPPQLTVSEWADAHRKLSPEASAEPGQWRTSRAPFQRGPMDALNDPNIETIVLMWSAQVGKTEIILNTIGYYIDQDPAPIMLVQPTELLAEAFSKDRLAPMLRDTPKLRDKVRDVKSRDSGNTLLHKKFPGGHITLAGSNAPSSLASRPIRVVLLDEVDRYPASAGTEGDPVNLVTKRTTTFWNRKRILVSTPTTKGISRIEFAYEQSTMEQYCYPCPSCDEFQPLTWPQLHFIYDDETKTASDVTHACRSCGEMHDEYVWKAVEAKWIARKKNAKTRGFHLNELSSTFVSWSEVVQNFMEAKRGGVEQLKTWTNTSLAETWEERGTGIESEGLMKRCEPYPADVPDEVVLLTCGVDVQDNRLEYEIVGWGEEAESWGIKYGVIMGNPGQKHVWDMLDAQVINASFSRSDGVDMQIMSTAIDTGGHFTKAVYTYCKKRELRRVWAIKGKGGNGIPLIMKPKRKNDAGVWLFNIGVDVGKDTLASRLASDTIGAGYCHFPASPDYDESYFKGLTSEHKVMRYIKGRPSFHWELKRAGSRNEPLDCRNYANVALEIIGGETVLTALLQRRQEEKEPSKAKAAVAPTRRKGVVNKGIG